MPNFDAVCSSLSQGVLYTECNLAAVGNRNVYDYTHRDVMLNHTISMNEYKGKVLMIINTATFWGLAGQMPMLDALQKELGHDKFEVLAFPANNFHLVNQSSFTSVQFPSFSLLNVPLLLSTATTGQLYEGAGHAQGHHPWQRVHTKLPVLREAGRQW